MPHIVTGPLAIVTDSTGQPRYLYQGAALPEGIPDVEVERLTDAGLVSKVDEPVAVLVEEADTSKSASTAGSGDVQRPSDAATKATWVEYTVARGMDRDKAEAMTKQELIDAYPPE